MIVQPAHYRQGQRRTVWRSARRTCKERPNRKSSAFQRVSKDTAIIGEVLSGLLARELKPQHQLADGIRVVFSKGVPMRPIVLSVCVFAAACSGQISNSPTSPTSAAIPPAQSASATSTPVNSQALRAEQLPFRGSFTHVIDVPPPSAHATAEGTATHLGRFTATLRADVHPDNTSTGTFNFVAANGDQLSGTFVGEGVFIPPNNSRLTEVATIENGTGRFAGATGTFTMMRFDTIDFATGKATGSGSFEGRINLNK
jgi:hypothetical protein